MYMCMCTFRTGEACTCTAAISSGPRTRRQSRRRLCIPSTAPTPRRSSDKTKRETRRTVQTRPASALCFNTHTRSHTHTHVFIAESVHTHTYNRLHTHTRRATSVAALGIELSKTERERSEQILRAPPNLRTSPSKVRLAPAAGASGQPQRL